MRLVVGGACQGKLAWILKQSGQPDLKVAEPGDENICAAVFNHLHLWIRKWMQEGRDPEEEINRVLQSNPKIIILCDEIGSGVVPLDAFEREWRERTGRICCMLACKAEQVERIFCGIPTVLKSVE